MMSEANFHSTNIAEEGEVSFVGIAGETRLCAAVRERL
jgi:hypothetical protein